MEVLLMIVIAVVAIALGAVFWGVSAYNKLIRGRHVIQESWRQVDVELNRRYDLIPNLIETVRGYAAHERNSLEQITALRNQAAGLAHHGDGAPTGQRAAVEAQLSEAVRSLMVSVEAYPDLKSNVNFLELQRELTDTEDRIAAGRRFYNANVREYNTRIESVPSNVIANFGNFQQASYFEVNDAQMRQAPTVNFGEISQRPAGEQGGQLGQLPPTQAPQPFAAPQVEQPQAQPHPRPGQQ
ncbi:MAG TPA: LemA family protein [Arachnia sp.]|nr:LemA family protein [Arachnia sp.]HMT87368.1 LemA family protein [Arachnia sp.]